MRLPNQGALLARSLGRVYKAKERELGEGGILWSAVGMSEELTDHKTHEKEEHKKVLIKEQRFFCLHFLSL